MDGRGGVLRRLAARLTGRADDSVPAAYDAPPEGVESMLTRVWWADTHTLALSGWVYAAGTSVTPDDRPGLGVRLEAPDHTVEVEASMLPLVDPAVNETAGDAGHDYSGAAFEAEIDVRVMRIRAPGPCTVVFSLDADDGPVTSPFADRDVHGSAGRLVDSAVADGRVVRPDWSAANGLVLTLVPAPPVALFADGTRAESVEASPEHGTLTVRGSTDENDLVLELRGPRQGVRAEATVEDGAFEAVLPLQAPDWYAEDRPLGSGVYVLYAVGPDGTTEEVPLDPAALETVGELVEGRSLHARVERTVRDTVRVRLDPPLRADERGAFAQMQLRREYHAMPEVTERSAVFYECYYGVSCTDSARAIHDELVARGAGVEHLWGVADLSVPVPAPGRGVLRFSREWWAALGRSAYLTFNAGLPAGLVRRPGQVLVQTWHGTPFKLLGHDRPVNHDKEGFAASTARYVSRWDHLLAGNPHSAEVFRRAWFYDGSVLELGYPRNDALARPDPDATRAVRERLGIAGGATVVLYAPTWRDGQRVMPDLLDLDLLSDELGPDVVFLVRSHMNITRWKQRPEGGTVLDVTSYPEIDDLFLVADVAVTDYSSIMFDFSVTRKPMLFFVPDLDDYRDRRRGVYLDLAETAPGPLLETTEQVVEALRDLDRTAYDATYGERYDAWVARFNPLDDGHAASRVVDAVYSLD